LDSGSCLAKTPYRQNPIDMVSPYSLPNRPLLETLKNRLSFTSIVINPFNIDFIISFKPHEAFDSSCHSSLDHTWITTHPTRCALRL
jgi:hypothetical protein